MPSDPKGLYSFVRDGSRIIHVWTEYPDDSRPMEVPAMEVPESVYRDRGYLPLIEELPTREAYEATRSEAATDRSPNRKLT